MAHNILLDNMSDSESSDPSESGSESSCVSSSEQLSHSLEPTRILKQALELPKGLCENVNIFNEFFSLDTWECLPDHMKDQLKPFLPNFSEVCDNEVEAQHEAATTIQNLFTNQITRFNISPLIDFQRNLEEGNYRPDISRLRDNIQKSQKREQRFQQCERISRLAKTLAVSRERLLRGAYESTDLCGIEEINQLVTSTNKLTTTAAAARAKKRYYEEISSIHDDIGLEEDLTDDESESEGTQFMHGKKPKRMGNQPVLGGGSEPKIVSTMTRKGYTYHTNHVSLFDNPNSEEVVRGLIDQHKSRKNEDPDHIELDTADIKISDIYSRTHNTPGRKPSAKNAPNTMQLSAALAAVKNETDLSIDPSDADILPTVSTSFEVPSLDSSHIHLSSQFCLANNSLLDNGPIDVPGIDIKHSLHDVDLLKNDVKEEKIDVCKQFLKDDDFRPNKPSDHLLFDDKTHTMSNALINSTNTNTSMYVKEEDMINSNMMDTKFDVSLLPLVAISSTELNLASITADIKHEHKLANDKLIKSALDGISFHDKVLKTDTFEDLDSIEIMRLPVDLDDAGNIDLLDDIVVNMKPELLQESHSCFLSLIRDVFCSTPDHRTTLDNLHSKITTWISNPITALNDWYGLVDSWLDALPSAIHFLAGEFPHQPNDFVPYVEYKQNLNIYQWIGAGRDSDQHLKQLCELWLNRRNEMSSNLTVRSSMVSELSSNINAQLLDESGLSITEQYSLPVSRCPTSWIVRKATDKEVAEFRKQEGKRFENPHKAFTYRMHGYESIVGPVKGIYTHTPAMAKARGHTMLTADRPHYVTILTLVRDATARLPNGEGTRAEICELLKSSQYICPTASEVVLQTIVSGALDRMHADDDPCVRYDSKRKIWIYLHRNRSEMELERAHQESQNVTKQKKKTNRKAKAKVDSVSSEASVNEFVNQSNINPLKSVSPAVATIKKKGIVKTQQSPGIVVLSSAPQTATISTAISAAGKISQPTVLATMNSPPIPSLSTIQPSLLSPNPPPLINQINAAVTQRGITQPDLVPIHQFIDAKIEHVDMDANVDNTSMIIKKSPTTQNQPHLTGMLLDQNQPMNNKVVVKQRIGVVSPAPNVATGKTPSAATMQAIHIPARAADHRSPGNQVRRLQQSKTMPPLIAAQGAHNQSFVIPISISGKTICNMNKKFQPVVVRTSSAKSLLTSSTIKTTTVPVLSTAARPPSILQAQHPQIVTVSGKTMIRSAVSNAPAGTASMQLIHAKPVQQQTQQPHQQKIIVAGANVLNNAGNKATFVGTSQAGTPILVQKITAVSKSQPTSANIIVTTSPTIVSTPSLTFGSSTPPGTSLINPHILPKVQTISTANLSPLQQQTLLQTINKQLRLQHSGNATQQQSLIIKPQIFTSTATISPVRSTKGVINVTAQGVFTSSSMNTSIMTSSTSTVLTAMPTKMVTATANLPTNVRTVSANSSLIGKVIADQGSQIISLENLVQSKHISMPALVAAQSSANQGFVIPISLSGKSIASINKTFQPLVMAQSRLMTQPSVDNLARPIASIGNVTMSGLKTTATMSTQANTSGKQEIVKIGTAPTIVQQSSTTPQLTNAKVIGVPVNQRVKSGTNIRMVNASNLNITNLANIANIANIDGKSVIIASKIQPNSQQINISPQQTTTANRPNIVFRQSGNTSQAMVFGNQIVKINTSTAGSVASRVVLNSAGQPIKFHTPSILTTSPAARNNINIKGANITASPGQRVVLAVQGGGQILLPANFQSGSINLKHAQGAQGLKMISVQPTQIQPSINAQTIAQAQVLPPSVSTKDDS